MNVLEEALERREAARVRYLRDFLKVGGKKTNFATFGMSDVADYVPPEQRLAIGVAFGDDPKSLGLALRASKHGGVAHRAALDLANAAEKERSWADYKIVSDLSIPARTSVTAIKRGNPFALGGDPLTIGVSVSHPKSPAGSLGGFVKFPSGEDGIISACHVLANSGRGVDVSEPDKAPLIYHPASGDADGGLTPDNRIARLQNFVELTTSSVEIDAAVAVLLPKRVHTGNVVPSAPGAEGIGKPISKPPPPSEIARFRSVAKVGRTTGYTKGTLTAGFFDDVGLEVPGQGIVYYSRLFEVQSPGADFAFAQPGDSGATVFDTETQSAFALVVGGGVWDDHGNAKMLVYCCSLAAALKKFKVDWL